MVLGNSSEGPDSAVGGEDEEEKLLKQAIALSLEGSAESEWEEDAKEAEEEEEEDLMLKQAIALSLEGTEEEDDQEAISWTLMQPKTMS